jgi:hypothetical protein
VDHYPTAPREIARMRHTIVAGVAGAFSVFGLVMFVGGMIGLETKDWSGPLTLVTKGVAIAHFDHGTSFLIPTLAVTVILGAVSIATLVRLSVRDAASSD